MKKTFVLIIFLLSLSLSAMAQLGESMYGDKVKCDIKMDYVYSLEEAITQAQKTNKPIFFNCFADWAIPCHVMNKVVFSDKDFCDFMNENFVNLIMDLSVRENLHIAERYGAKSFAHFVVLDKNGELIHRISGGSELPDFKTKVTKALNPKTSLKGLEKRYNDGDRSKSLLQSYALALLDANDDKFDVVKEEYVKAINKKELLKKENYRILRRLIDGIDSEWFKFFVDNREKLAKENGADAVYNNITSYYSGYFYPYSVSSDGYEAGKMLDMYNEVLKMQIPDKYKNEIDILYSIAKSRAEKRYDNLFERIEKGFGDIPEQIYSSIELSLANMPDMTTLQEKWVVDYLNKRAESLSGSLKVHYENATKVILKEGIKFETLSFKELLTKAKEENKPLFIDCYTAWCGPCKTLSNTVFPIKEIGDFFNKEFLSSKIDMEKGEGIELAKKYNIKSYPTMLILNGDGEEVYRIIGAVSPGKLLNEAKVGLNICKNLAPVKAKYETGDRTLSFMTQYFDVMGSVKEIANPKEKAEEYFFGLQRKEQIVSEALPFFEKFAASPQDKLFDFMMKNIDDYGKIVDKEEMNKIISKTYFPRLFSAISQYGVKSIQLKNIVSDIEKYRTSDDFSITFFAEILRKYNTGDINGLMKTYKEDVATMTNKSDMLNTDMLLIYIAENATSAQKEDIKSYIQSQLDNADPRAVNGYKRILKDMGE